MRDQRFTFLCTKEERSTLEHLAKLHRRSQGDTIRQLISEAAQKTLEDAQTAPVIVEKKSQDTESRKPIHSL